MRWTLLLLAGCSGMFPEPNLERMKDQPNLRPYEESHFFANQMAMRVPPAHTVPRQNDAPPAPLDRALIERGHNRFDIYCAACHGRKGDGASEVARNMDLRKPPSLIDAEVRGFSDERILGVITEGYGLMPSYATELSPDEQRGVVAYVRALQISQGVPLKRLPPAMRAAAEKALP